MTTTHDRTNHIEQAFNDYMDRCAVPRQMASDEAAQKRELNLLLSIILKRAPDREYESWTKRLFEKVAIAANTRVWPTAKEIYVAIDSLHVPAANRAPGAGNDKWRPDSLAIAARCMADGEPVGEGYLYGTKALELLRRDLVAESTMRAYRSAWFLGKKNIYGEAKALQMEADAKDRHQAAIMLADRTRAALSEPPAPKFKRMPSRDYDGADTDFI